MVTSVRSIGVEPAGIFEPMSQIEEDEDGYQLESVGGKTSEGEPKIDSGGG
jgi:hypothetical protein